jgi:Concanavalin A-like lectin/glucanases superfamily/PEP-CTERM motif
MKTIKIQKLIAVTVLASLFGITTQAQTPFYSVNGIGGTGGGTAGVTVAPGASPSGSSTLTDFGGSTQFSFGTGPGGVAGESIVNAAAGQAGSGVLAGTLGASSSLSAFTVTMWVNLATASLNNYRILEISPGSPPTTGSADGTKLFFGLNAGGGLQLYVNNVNGNTTGTDIATANTWNNGGTLGAIAANSWYFVAVTYDTIGGSSLLYSGDLSDSATLAYTYNNLAGGALDLSSATSIALSDRFSGGRNFPGALDDVNLYGGALTQSQIDTIRLSQLVPAPEPGTLAMIGLGTVLSLGGAVRRKNK